MTFSDRRRMPPSSSNSLATANTRTIPTQGAGRGSVQGFGGAARRPPGQGEIGPAQRRAHIGPLTLAESRKHPSMHLYTDSYSGWLRFVHQSTHANARVVAIWSPITPRPLISKAVGWSRSRADPVAAETTAPRKSLAASKKATPTVGLAGRGGALRQGERARHGGQPIGAGPVQVTDVNRDRWDVVHAARRQYLMWLTRSPMLPLPCAGWPPIR